MTKHCNYDNLQKEGFILGLWLQIRVHYHHDREVWQLVADKTARAEAEVSHLKMNAGIKRLH